ncbi:MAG: TonB-dependent receptor [Saprospiraceae bacterium]|nr:TonB-dependent receptor [Saprospiraceae bacterium]
MIIIRFIIFFFIWLSAYSMQAQETKIYGQILHNNHPLAYANVSIAQTTIGNYTDSLGRYSIDGLSAGPHRVVVSLLGFKTIEKLVTIDGPKSSFELVLEMEELATTLGEVVVSANLKEVNKLDSPVPVEVYSTKFFRTNPTPSMFEAMQSVNGVRPQINCNVCNTGDIHINGLEGPYTMVLIDGMPIVSGLSTVYGLTGIPHSLIERIEIVKGPASTLYGSEAVGGLVNIITKKPGTAPTLALDAFTTSWLENNVDLGLKFKGPSKSDALLGANYFSYQNPFDKNSDGFTDVTLQSRLSLFNKWSFHRPSGRLFTWAARYIYEDRWGGDMRWTPEYRGGSEIYGESIYTNRWETFGTYQLPTSEDIKIQISANGHRQNSVYGNTIYHADQYIGFGQLTWQKTINKKHQLLAGAAYRYTYYDDNTSATDDLASQAGQTHLPGLFIQDDIVITDQHRLLVGVRYDHNSLHGSIFTPRLNFKWNSPNKRNILRASIGNGYRVANIFTEDHAALTGARTLEFDGELQPERSWNANLNFVKKLFVKQTAINLDASVFYTHFDNRIIPDYETDPNKIIYSNLDGSAVSKGLSLNLDVITSTRWKFLAGATLLDVTVTDAGVKERQLLTERFSGVWNISYRFTRSKLTLDYTGNVYSPMRLPLLGPLDQRPDMSSWWSIQNIQITKGLLNGFEVYGGVKNLLNFTPPANSIARAFDPFDNLVSFDQEGQVIPTTNNPQALTFDPTYVFAPNQGIRLFLGFRYAIP